MSHTEASLQGAQTLNTSRASCFLVLFLAWTVAGPGRVEAAPPQTAGQQPTRSAISIPHDTNGLKDCGSDATCFLAALEDGKAAKVRRTRSHAQDGTSIVETSYAQVSNFTGEQCTYFLRLESLSVTLTEQARASLRQQGVTEAELNAIPDLAHQAVGSEQACVFNRASLITLMRRWNQDQTSLEDFMRADHCEGDYAPVGAAFFPRTSLTHTARSWWLLETGKIEEAEQELRLAFVADPAYELPEAHRCMGEIYLRQQKPDPALAEFLKAVELNPLHNTAWADLARAYALRGNVEKAVEQLRRQIDVNKKNGLQSTGPYSLLCTISNDGPAERTVQACEDALKQYQGDALVWNQLAWTYATSKDPRYRDSAKALEYAQKAVSLSEGKTPELLDTLAEAYFVSGNFDKAIETERRALELSPDEASFKEGLARYLRAKNATR
jgi:tetratricopeptide (TPR) repeat protein